MRMWMVPPETMCNRHLLGEHVETHMLAGSLRCGRSIQGFLDKGLLEPAVLQQRHDVLAREMRRRGMQHASPLEADTACYRTGYVDVQQADLELRRRCPDCRTRGRR